METRSRRRRMDNSAAGAAAISVQQRDTAGQEVTRAQSAQAAASRATPSSQRMGLGALPIARRGARATERRASIASIRTVPLRADDETVLDEEEGALEMAADDSIVVLGQPEEESLDEEARITKLKIMELSLGDLAASTGELLLYLDRPAYHSPVFRGRLKIKKRTFESVRESFAEGTAAPFIDWTETGDIWSSEEEAGKAKAVMVRANIATALYQVTALQTDVELDDFPLFDRLNSCFHLFFQQPEDILHHPEVPELLLEIRTWCLIETLEELSGNPDIRKIIASVFGETDGKSDFESLVGGASGELGESSLKHFEELRLSRIEKLTLLVEKDTKTRGVPALKEEFPLETLLDEIATWLKELSHEKNIQSQAERKPESERLLNYEEDFEDSQTTVSESQPIVRPGAGVGNSTSLFVGRESIQYLNSRSRTNHLAPPPSNQHQMMPPPGAPRDYQEHSNSALLDSPRSSPSGSAFPGTQKTASKPARKGRARRPFEIQEQDDEEEDDEFETDTRVVAPGKRATLEATLPSPKRARLEVVPWSSNPDQLRQKSTAPPSSSARTSEMISSSHPTRADFDTLRQAKAQVSQQVRATLSPLVRQRFGWSHNDMLLLLQLIRDRHAAWANIEKYDNDKFEHPRNQQAYRDKARNMKVDYLLTDAVLPPCFDLVALSKKEIDRLISFGKNPHRREDDVDQDGRAVNTEYLPTGVK
ncbi:hypothetical protein BGZ63DRAFT_421180 [Mariannaea sp. PMI_226]|nr:hypothetical protein BGZ63DRAFT_421180 [Mariannaea sp. PMI_226]